MSTAADWVPSDIDVGIPSAARVYDYLLGGAHNFDVDRIVGEKVLAAVPNGREIARSNRAFMSRAGRSSRARSGRSSQSAARCPITCAISRPM